MQSGEQWRHRSIWGVGSAFLASRGEYLSRLVQLRMPLARPRQLADADVVVSLTTFGPRLEHVHRTILSLLHQSVRPQKIVLALSKDELGDVDIPEPLLALERYNVEILWDNGNRLSYKKLLPALTAYPNATIVTFDDDVLYPSRWLERLLDTSAVHPGHVVCGRAKEITYDADKQPLPYVHWPRSSNGTLPNRALPTGVGGVLYPPGSLDSRVSDYPLAARVAPHADDMWFKAMSQLAGAGSFAMMNQRVRDLPPAAIDYIDTRSALMTKNLAGGNDTQISAVQQEFSIRLGDYSPTLRG